MAIIRCVEASVVKMDAKYESGKRTATRTFYVLLDAPAAGPQQVVQLFKAYTSIEIGQGYSDEDDTGCVLKSITPANLNSTTTDFILTLSYEPPASNDPSQNNPNPLMRPDEDSVSGSSGRRPYFTDYTPTTPKTVTTTAGEPFATLPENDVGEFELVIRGPRASFDAATWPTYLRPACAISTASVTIRGITYPAGSLKMKSMRMARKYENGVSYFEMEWTISVADTWDQAIENRGFSSLVSGKPMPILQADGKTPVSASYPLNADGTKKTSPTDTPSTITFKPQPKKDFSVFAWTSAA